MRFDLVLCNWSVAGVRMDVALWLLEVDSRNERCNGSFVVTEQHSVKIVSSEVKVSISVSFHVDSTDIWDVEGKRSRI